MALGEPSAHLPNEITEYIAKEGKNLDYNSYLVPKYKAIDIDEMGDWKIAEALFKNHN